MGAFRGRVILSRVTYVIDREGIVRHVFSSQLGFVNQIEEALQALRAISWRAFRPVQATPKKSVLGYRPATPYLLG
jgi:alkyl hydroperoxide reductase subunit AhpC